MVRTVTMTVDTVEADGGIYIKASERRLEDDDDYSGAVVLDIQGHLALVWWDVDGHPTYLAENGAGGVPRILLGDWCDQIREWARQDGDLGDLYRVAEYCESVASKLEQLLEDFYQSGEARQTDGEVIRAIVSEADYDPHEAARIWEDPTKYEVVSIAGRLRDLGIDPATQHWGAAGTGWASKSRRDP